MEMKIFQEAYDEHQYSEMVSEALFAMENDSCFVFDEVSAIVVPNKTTSDSKKASYVDDTQKRHLNVSSKHNGRCSPAKLEADLDENSAMKELRLFPELHLTVEDIVVLLRVTQEEGAMKTSILNVNSVDASTLTRIKNRFNAHLWGTQKGTQTSSFSAKELLDAQVANLRFQYKERFSILHPILLEYYSSKPNFAVIRENISCCQMYLTSNRRLKLRLKPALDVIEEVDHVKQLLQALSNMDPDEKIDHKSEEKMKKCWQQYHDKYFNTLKDIFPKLHGLRQDKKEQTDFLQQVDFCYDTLKKMPTATLPNWERVVLMGGFAHDLILAASGFLNDSYVQTPMESPELKRRYKIRRLS